MKKILVFAAALLLNVPAFAANTSLSNLSAGSAIADTDLFYDVQSVGAGGVKVTGTQFWTWIGTHLVSPGPIGSSTPSTGAFTTLSATSTVSGAGFTALFASPPAIGGTAAAAGKFTTLQATGNLTTNITGSTQCVHANSSGILSGTGSDCGSGGGGSGITIGTTTITSGTDTRVLFDNAGVVGEYIITGTGNVVMSASPTLTGTISAAALTLTGNLTTNITGGGTVCVQASNTGVLSSSGSACGGGSSTITSGTTPTSGFTNQALLVTSGSVVVGSEFLWNSTNHLLMPDGSASQPALQFNSLVGGFQTGIYLNSTAITFSGQTNNIFSFDFAIMRQTRDTVIYWCSQFNALNGCTLGIAQNGSGSGILEVNNGSKGTLASLTATTALFTTLASDATHTDNTVCADTGTGLLYKGSGTAGICLGTSSARFKDGIAPLVAGLEQINNLDAITYKYKPGYGDSGETIKYGFTAEQVYQVLPDLVGLDNEGKPNSIDWAGIVPVLVKAIQEQQKEIEVLKKKVQ
jgi:hypothetical protein